MLTIKELQDIKDFSTKENSIKFKKLYESFLHTHTRSKNYQDLAFNHLIRQIKPDIRVYTKLLNLCKVSHLENPEKGIDRHLSMYNLDQLDGWSSNNPSGIVKMAMAADIPAGEIIDYMYMSGFTNDLTQTIELLIKNKHFEDLLNISWPFYREIGIESPSLNKLALEFYNSLDFKERHSLSLNFSKANEHLDALIHYFEPMRSEIKDWDLLSVAITSNNWPTADTLMSTRYKMLYKVWENKLFNQGFDSEDEIKQALYFYFGKKSDASIFGLVHEASLINAFKRDILQHGSRIINLVPTESINSLINENWCRPYIESKIDLKNIDNNVLDLLILRTNKLYHSPSSSNIKPYSEDFLKEAFLELIRRGNQTHKYYDGNYGVSLSLIEYWFERGSNGNLIKEGGERTPLYKLALAFALVSVETGMILDKPLMKRFNAFFPGFESEKGRAKLINTYFPESKEVLKLASLYSIADLVTLMLDSNIKNDIRAEDLPLLDIS